MQEERYCTQTVNCIPIIHLDMKQDYTMEMSFSQIVSFSGTFPAYIIENILIS